VVAAVGFRTLGDWRNEAQSWLVLLPQTALLLGVLLFEASIVRVFALYAASVAATSGVIVGLVYGGSAASAVAAAVGPSPAMACVLLDIIILAFRTRARQHARRLVQVDQGRYRHAWTLVHQASGASRWIRDLADLVAELSARCPSAAPRQLVNLPSPGPLARRPSKGDNTRVTSPGRADRTPGAETSRTRIVRTVSIADVAGDVDDGRRVGSLDQLYVQALCLHPILLRKTRAWAAASAGSFAARGSAPGDQVGLATTGGGGGGEEFGREAEALVQVRFAGIKSVSRAVEKAVRSYAQVRLQSRCSPWPRRSCAAARPFARGDLSRFPINQRWSGFPTSI
jgi:hypothetical protein